MKNKCIFQLLLVLKVSTYSSFEDLYNSEYYYTELDDIQKLPDFVTESSEVVVSEGETIILPCVVTNLQGFVVLWQKEGRTISVGKHLLRKAHTYYHIDEIKNGNKLVIEFADEVNEGTYVCQVSALQTLQIQHTVRIKVKPSLIILPQQNSLTIKEGEELEVFCKIKRGKFDHGNLRLFWRKLDPDFRMDDGMLMTKSVHRNHSGNYECAAIDENNVEVVSKEFTLFVEYPPDIKIEVTEQNDSKTKIVNLTCIVEGNPEPSVDWLKNDQLINLHQTGINNFRSGKIHTLIVQMRKDLYGEFSCEVRNYLGYANRTTIVTEFSKKIQMKKKLIRIYSDSIVLEWTVKSLSDITGFRVKWQAKGSLTWNEKSVSSSKIYSEFNTWTGQVNLVNLLPKTRYFVKIASHKKKSYSAYSDVYSYKTLSEMSVLEKRLLTSTAAITYSSCYSVTLLLSILGKIR